MKEIKLTKGKVAIVDDEDFECLNQWKWHVNLKNGGFYAYRRHYFDDPKSSVYISMHRQIMNCPSGMVVDHINHDTLDNRRINLRVCTRRQNQCNVTKRKNTSSSYKGVMWNKTRKEWVVQVHLYGKRAYNGYFKDEISAAKTYDEQAKIFYGQFAKLNFPE